MMRLRIFLTGVGGQGTLTATTLLAKAALDEGFLVSAGEIHGMAQRGGVVESAVLLGGYLSPKIGFGEAGLLLGFEPLETLRALPYLASGGMVVGNTESVPPLRVSLGQDTYPKQDVIEAETRKWAARAVFVPCRELGARAGNAQSANMVLLGAAAGAGALPFGLDALERAATAYLKPALAKVNLAALRLGAAAAQKN
ncbi:MAG: 2-oxoacid:acceptor oxidoreductase family protein [Desulfovibrionaceae bacterium]|nr:2-oxoacid:acceptor oxidoreductase family protein [Desulfovibrionaceae bacterium]MBF0513807.1 2-oxoacid:acceptor oxidoreductase family protein [Desulfovibrionaceae bacterium]